ncbi:oligosaccharide flippase family protein [Chloroflexota bacterium]
MITERPGIRRNLIANVLGGSWGMMLGLLVIPIQIRLLGAEAYGLIGFAMSLLAIFSFLDFGLATTVTREVAGDTSKNYQFTYDLIETAATIYWTIALILAVGLAFGADWIATHWLEPETLDPAYVAQALRILAVWLFFAWLQVLYIAILTGLQRLEILNIIRAGVQTLLQVGGVVVILLTDDFHLFLVWYTFVAGLAVFLFTMATRRIIPKLRFRPTFSFAVIKRIRRFSLDVNFITILGIIYTQADRILISMFLPLSTLGYYGAVYKLASSISMLQVFLNTAMFPVLSADFNHGEGEKLQIHYRKYVQIVGYLTGLLTITFIFYGDKILTFWVTLQAAEEVLAVFILLCIGFWLSALTSSCASLILATGNSRALLWINFWGIGVYIAVLLVLLNLLGVTGLGLAWMLINIFSLFMALFFMFNRIPTMQQHNITSSVWHWLRNNLLAFLIPGGSVFIVVKVMASVTGTDTFWFIWCGLSIISYTVIGFFMLASDLRQDLISIFNRFLKIVRVHNV